MDQSSHRPFPPRGPEQMLQEMIQILSDFAPEPILFSDRNVLFPLMHIFLSVVTKYISNIYKSIYVYLFTHTLIYTQTHTQSFDLYNFLM